MIPRGSSSRFSARAKRWAAALVAVLFLSTATLHVLAHHGETDDDCAVCQVQAASLPAAPAPAVVCVRTIELLAPPAPVARFRAARPAAAPARAPPAVPA
jgi:hypothetical protein